MSEKTLSIIVSSYNMEKYLTKGLGRLVVAPGLMAKYCTFFVRRNEELAALLYAVGRGGGRRWIAG